MSASDVCYWLADNIEFWRPIAIFFLAGFAIGVLYVAFGVGEEVSHD